MRFVRVVKKSIFLPLFLLMFLFSCNKEDEILSGSDVALNYSSDLVSFDTVFTSVFTSTKQLVVYNPYNQKVKISSIRLAGNQSYFSLNINGAPTNSASDVELEAKDSLYIFIKANINPNNQNNPLIVTDSIIFDVNGNIQDVDIVACGQDAHFIVPDHHVNGLPPYKIIAQEGQHIDWQNDKPYVIYGYAVVDSTASLSIAEGCKIYLHKNGGMWIYKGGSLKVQGTKNNPVVFQGDRRESWYATSPGQWDRIWLNEGSVDNEINYAVIKNGFIGIQAETIDVDMGNKLTLTNTVIENMSGAGLLAKRYSINASNNLIYNCGQYLVALTGGGTYQFVHNTLSNQWAGSTRTTPSVFLSNYITTTDAIIVSDLNVSFANSIVYGNLAEEVQFDKKNEANFMVAFDHCLLKTAQSSSYFLNCIQNVDPQFKSLTDNNYRLLSNSPAINAGNVVFGPLFPLDYLEFARDGMPDMGAIEFNSSDTKKHKRP